MHVGDSQDDTRHVSVSTLKIFVLPVCRSNGALKCDVSCSCRYSIHLWDVNQEGSWDNKSSYVYYTDLLMELLLLGLDLLHHIHMLVSMRLFIDYLFSVIDVQRKKSVKLP